MYKCRIIYKHMTEKEISLEKLSQLTGIEQRTIRSWISQGLLLPPNRTGRGAQYPKWNLDRALAVRALKELHGESLASIRKKLMLASDSEIREWAQEAGTTQISMESPREYLKRIQVRDLQERRIEDRSIILNSIRAPRFRKNHVADSKPAKNFQKEQMFSDVAGVEGLIQLLQSILAKPVPRRARGKTWTRISITPDVEISIRGELEPRDRALFEQLADLFRAILTGRKDYD